MADVLIAGDSPFVRTLLGDLLGGEHDVVAEVENGVEAVEVYEERRPDLVLMDVGMPIRNGIEATDQLTADHPDANVIVYGSDDGDERRSDAFEVGAVEYLAPPFQKAGLLDAVAAAVP